MRCVLGLQENVVTGMADGYFRIAGKPACTLLHCGPGLANGLGNLHNARRARSGIINIVGDQATYHRPLDAPLTADTDALARTVSAWVRTSTKAAAVGQDAAAAVQAAQSRPGQIATLILPSDASWDEGGIAADPLPQLRPAAADPQAIEAAARVLRDGRNVLLLLAGRAVLGEAQATVWRISAATGASLMADFVTPHSREDEAACSWSAFLTAPIRPSRLCGASITLSWSMRSPSGLLRVSGQAVDAISCGHTTACPDHAGSGPGPRLGKTRRAAASASDGDPRSGPPARRRRAARLTSGEARPHSGCSHARERHRVGRKRLLRSRLLSPQLMRPRRTTGCISPAVRLVMACLWPRGRRSGRTASGA